MIRLALIILALGWAANAQAQAPIPGTDYWSGATLLHCDGVSDDAPALSAILVAMKTRGGGKLMLPLGRRCGLASRVSITASNVELSCEGGGNTRHDAPDPKAGCGFVWLGQGNDYMLDATAPSGSCGASPGQSWCTSLTGIHLLGLSFDGRGIAKGAIKLRSLRAAELGYLYGTGFVGGGNEGVFDVDVVHRASPADFGDTCDSQVIDAHNLAVDQVGFTTSAFAWHGYSLAGAPNGGCDASLSVLRDSLFNIGPDSRGVIHGGDDGTRDVRVSVVATGNAPGWEFRATTGPDGSRFPANDILVDASFSNGPLVIYGQQTYPGCVSGQTCPFAIKFRDMLMGTPLPAAEPGVRPFIDYNWSDLSGRGLPSTPWSPTLVCDNGQPIAGSWLYRAQFQKHENRVDFNVFGYLGQTCNAVLIGLPVPGVNASPVGGVQGYDLATGRVLGGWVDGTNQAIRATPGVVAFGAGAWPLLTGSYESAQ